MLKYGLYKDLEAVDNAALLTFLGAKNSPNLKGKEQLHFKQITNSNSIVVNTTIDKVPYSFIQPKGILNLVLKDRNVDAFDDCLRDYGAKYYEEEILMVKTPQVKDLKKTNMKEFLDYKERALRARKVLAKYNRKILKLIPIYVALVTSWAATTQFKKDEFIGELGEIGPENISDQFLVEFSKRLKQKAPLIEVSFAAVKQ